MHLEIVYRYTNISFTDKQKEDPAKLYDLLAGSKFCDDVFTVLPQSEYRSIATWLGQIAEHIYAYRNSIYGILDAIKTDYSTLDFDAESIRQKIADPEALTLLKDVLSKLG